MVCPEEKPVDTWGEHCNTHPMGFAHRVKHRFVFGVMKYHGNVPMNGFGKISVFLLIIKCVLPAGVLNFG